MLREIKINKRLSGITIFRKLSLLFFIILVFFSLKTYPQSPRLPFTFDQIKIANNSIQNNIQCMLKDRNGYLWLGTMGGLKRYDAELIVTLRHDPKDKHSLVHNGILSLCEDHQNRIWVGTTEGICYFDKKKNYFVRFDELSKPDYACLNIICDAKGNVWFTIRDRGLFRFDPKTNRLQNFHHNDTDLKSISSNRVFRYGLLEDPTKKGLWIATNKGLNYLDFSSQRIFSHSFNPNKIPILNTSIASALTFHQNKLVFGSTANNEVVWYDTHQNKIVKTFKPTLSTGEVLYDIFQLFFDANQNLWLSTFGAKMAYVDFKKNLIIPITYDRGNSNSFSANYFLDVLQETNGTIWFATVNGISIINGLSALNLDNRLFDIYDFSNSIFKGVTDDRLMDLMEEPNDSTWWMISQKNRLIHYNPNTNQHSTYRIPLTNFPPNTDIPIFIHNYQTKALIFMPFSFFIFDKVTKKFKKIEMPKVIAEGKKCSVSHTRIVGNLVWVFVKGENMYEAFTYHLKSQEWKTYPILFSKGAEMKAPNVFFAPTFSLISSTEEFWIAIHSGGLAKFSEEKQAFVVIKTKQDIDFTKVGYTGFVEDKNGKFWLGTYDLIKFDPKTYDFQSIINTDYIGSLTIDNRDNLCMATLDEVMFFNEKKGEKYTFTFQTNEPINIWTNKLVNLSNHKIISVNPQMVVLLDFRNMKMPSFKDQLYINRISNADTTILINENNAQVSFGAEQNSFSINFGVLSPPDTRLYEFAYKLDGYDKDWIIDKEGKSNANYGRVEGGDYTFKVRATDVNKQILPIQIIKIHIDTPFYKTLWLRGLLAFLAVLIFVLFLRFRANQRQQIHHLQLQSTRLAKDKAEIQYQNLINHLNPHFLFNSLASLGSLIVADPKQASKFLQKLSAIYRYIIQNKENESVTIEHEISFVKNFVELQNSRFRKGLEITIDVGEESLSRGIVPVTLQNLFENAIKHNIIDDESPLKINVYIEDEYLIVRNNLQRRSYVDTSNKQGLDSLKKLYSYLSDTPFQTFETEDDFFAKVPLL